MMKLSLLLLAAIAVAGVSAIDCGKAPSHNATFGKRQYGDKLLFMDTPKKSSSFLRVVETDVDFKPSYPRPTITYIEILDQYTDGNGGCAYITKGGVSEDNVSIHIKSQRNHGFNFVVRVYGIQHY